MTKRRGNVVSTRAVRKGAVALAALALAGTLAACGSSPPPATTTTTTTTTIPKAPASLGALLPLYPFSTASQVDSWVASQGTSSASWHLSATATALKFAAWLGFAEISQTFPSLSVLSASSAHVAVGFYVPGTTTMVRSAVVHLVRWGTGSRAPWEVVGTDDTTFSLSTPAYGSTTASPVAVGGRISGVDENIKVRVRSLSSSADIGLSCCSAAGGVASPWSRSVSFTASSGTVLTVIAETGGHVATVERFTVTGLRAR